MPIKFYWGDDDFSLGRAVEALRQSVLDPNWASFNFDKIASDQSDAVIQGLNQAMTPPFGMGHRLIWLVDTTICQQCSPELLAELERTFSVIPENCVLLFTSRHKPDGRLKSTKLVQQWAEVQEFAAIPPWKTEQLIEQVRKMALEMGVKLTADAAEFLAECVGNDTRQLYSELEKLQLYAGTQGQPIGADLITQLVQSNTQNSLQLAAAIRGGETSRALGLVADLISHNEPALKIVATLIGQFRTWLWVKIMIDARERDERKIAEAAEVNNPKRIYFLKKEVDSIPLKALQASLPLLLELEASLKRGAEELSTLQTKVIEMCQLFRPEMPNWSRR